MYNIIISIYWYIICNIYIYGQNYQRLFSVRTRRCFPKIPKIQEALSLIGLIGTFSAIQIWSVQRSVCPKFFDLIFAPNFSHTKSISKYRKKVFGKKRLDSRYKTGLSREVQFPPKFIIWSKYRINQNNPLKAYGY